LPTKAAARARRDKGREGGAPRQQQLGDLLLLLLLRLPLLLLLALVVLTLLNTHTHTHFSST